MLRSFPSTVLKSVLNGRDKSTSPNDKIRFALIGAGARGFMDAAYALDAPSTGMIAVCDVYEGKLTRSREVYGNGIFTTRDYRDILAGKHVYLEQPMVHRVGEGKAVIEAWKKSGRIMQVGSQYTTSVIYRKVRELIQSGTIGQLNLVEGWFDRNTDRKSVV